MGEEEKKGDEVKKPEEVEKKVDEGSPAAAGGGGEKADGEAAANKAAEEDKKDESPPPPPEIVLRVFMHCEGCARKVRRCLKGFDGVEEVMTDCKTHTVVVKGEKADPIKVLERVQKKSHRQVELLSPIPPPPPPAEEPKKPPEEPPQAEEKKQPQVVSAILKVHMHCEACAQEIKRRIQRMKGVENVEPDFKGSLVTVKGIFEPPTLVDYIAKRTGKRVEIVRVEPEKAAEESPKEDKTAAAEGGEKKEEKTGGEEDAAGKEMKEGAAAAAPPADVPAEMAGTVVGFPDQDDPKLELRKNEFFYYYYPPPNYYHLHVPPPPLPPPRYGHQEIYGYGVEAHHPPPQMFSDDNPNACSVM
ncbi:unnamed protein product [Cuscuta campestris]|uniref:HMA domain-containing protein n=1 Tax=Cuscuta campestris TaxID=132261 RepID=A0A484LXY4_9ASTE|nr:unnamed protein product [Cuscuta campestris]